MLTNLLWLAALGQLALVAAGIAPETLSGSQAGARLGFALAAALTALIISSVTLTAVFVNGPMRTN